MNLTLTRTDTSEQGTFGTLTGDDGFLLATAEHAYQQDDGSYAPKIPAGTYTCHYGDHVLHSGPIKTFQLLNVPGHQGLLIHFGNYPQKDSDGCILVGESRQGNMILKSDAAFQHFLMCQPNLEDFTLTVQYA